MGDSHPLIWQGLGERIFKQEEVGAADDALLGKGLIYRTFRDDDHAKRAFERMCEAKGLGDVLAKRFVMSTVGKYDETLWESWGENGAQITGLGEEIEDLSMDEVQKLAVQYYPNLGKTNDWKADAKALFNSSPSKELYLYKYTNDEIFSKLVNMFFESTQKYLLSDDVAMDNINLRTPDFEPVLEAINEIGEVLGVYIVCLWQLEHDLKEIDKETEGRYEGGVMEESIKKMMKKDIQNLRVKVAHAVNAVLDLAAVGKEGRAL